MTYKFTVPALPSRFSTIGGLKYRAYSVYSGSASNSPLPSSLVSGSLSVVAGLSTQINNFVTNATTTYVWRGYFKPDATSTSWQFRTTSKDGSYVWLDTAAENPVANLNIANAIVDNGGTHSSTTVESSNQSLDSQFHYVITLVAGNNTGAGNVTLEWRRDGGAWESIGTTYLSSDNRYADGLGEDTYTASATPASYWVIGPDSGTGDIGYAANSNRTSWTFYDRTPGNAAAIDGAYGKDGSGNGIYVFSNSSSNRELAISSTDITDGVQWSGVDLPGESQQFCDAITWSNDSSNSTSGVWMAGRRNGHVYRSTDGASTFSEITLPNDSGDEILSIAGNGSGKFVTGQQGRLLISTDDGASFSSSTPFTAEDINGVAYTNQTWIVTYTKSGEANLYARTAADSDLTTWSSEQDLGVAKPLGRPDVNDPGPRANIAAYNGHVVVVPNRVASFVRFDVDGTSINNWDYFSLAIEKPRDITTDGLVYMMVTEAGDIYESTDGGSSFSKTVDDVLSAGTNMNAIAASVYLPL